MKYLVVIAVAWIVFWLWRQERRARLREQPPPTPTGRKASPQKMLRCAHCGVHLPAVEALRDADGRVYCCPAHRQAAQP